MICPDANSSGWPISELQLSRTSGNKLKVGYETIFVDAAAEQTKHKLHENYARYQTSVCKKNIERSCSFFFLIETKQRNEDLNMAAVSLKKLNNYSMKTRCSDVTDC